MPTPRSLSQASTSFIACNRQGIHPVHLVACLYNFDFSCENPVIQLSLRCRIQSNRFYFLRSLLILLITITTHPIIFGFFFRLLVLLLAFFQIVKELLLLRPLKDQIKTLSSSAWIWLFWWRLTGSNRRPPACKAGALPAELNPHFTWWVWLVSNQRPPRYQHGALTN